MHGDPKKLSWPRSERRNETRPKVKISFFGHNNISTFGFVLVHLRERRNETTAERYFHIWHCFVLLSFCNFIRQNDTTKRQIKKTITLLRRFSNEIPTCLRCFVVSFLRHRHIKGTPRHNFGVAVRKCRSFVLFRFSLCYVILAVTPERRNEIMPDVLAARQNE